MGEEILRIRIKELHTIRIVEKGITYEMPLGKIKDYLVSSTNNPIAGPLQALGTAIEQLSQSPHGIEIEFVIPVKH
jgi:hypothetical protein